MTVFKWDMTLPTLFLASGSKYRKALLHQYHLRAEQIAPQIDEAILTLEKPHTRAARLGNSKATSILPQVIALEPWLVIASDQVCHMDSYIYQKPGSAEVAAKHLAGFSGRWVTFSTSLVLLDHNGQRFETVEDYRLQFRELSAIEIEEYIKSDLPFDCAGAIKVESFGLSLMQNACGRDINSVQGLPIIALFEGLRKMGYPIFNNR